MTKFAKYTVANAFRGRSIRNFANTQSFSKINSWIWLYWFMEEIYQLLFVFFPKEHVIDLKLWIMMRNTERKPSETDKLMLLCNCQEILKNRCHSPILSIHGKFWIIDELCWVLRKMFSAIKCEKWPNKSDWCPRTQLETIETLQLPRITRKTIAQYRCKDL